MPMAASPATRAHRRRQLRDGVAEDRDRHRAEEGEAIRILRDVDAEAGGGARARRRRSPTRLFDIPLNAVMRTEPTTSETIARICRRVWMKRDQEEQVGRS